MPGTNSDFPNTMRKLLPIIFCLCLLTSCKTNPHSAPQTPLELFYGMEKDSNGCFYDSLFDELLDVSHEEYNQLWFSENDSLEFNMSIGIYLDDDFPNPVVREVILSSLDSLIAGTFVYDVYGDDMWRIIRGGSSIKSSSKEYLNEWKRIFENLTQLNRSKKKYYSLREIIGTRGCSVCHKVYEDDSVATYLLEFSYDYHASCGCPSYADYISVDKSTGRILTSADLFCYIGPKTLYKRLLKAYIDATKSKNYKPSVYSGEDLFNQADGVAIINEGMLIYYHPYTIGCGAEGQYNLIIEN